MNKKNSLNILTDKYYLTKGGWPIKIMENDNCLVYSKIAISDKENNIKFIKNNIFNEETDIELLDIIAGPFESLLEIKKMNEEII